MTPHDALSQATSESQAMSYDDAQLDAIRKRFVLDTWQSPRETTESRKGLCRDFAIYAIARTWELCGGLHAPAEIAIVLGHLDRQGEAAEAWHAWIELAPGDGAPVVWGEATPTYREWVGEPEREFPWRIPRYAQRFDGEVFDEEYEYQTRNRKP